MPVGGREHMKPCPFCGSPVGQFSNVEPMWACSNEQCKLTWEYFEDEDADESQDSEGRLWTAAEWNTRS